MVIHWDGGSVKTISAIKALAHRCMHLPTAKLAVEAMLVNKRAYIVVPKVESLDALTVELREAGVGVTIATASDPDIKATRDHLGLTQEQFAIRFGLDLDTVRNWEHGRRRPDTAVRSYLQAIANDPRAVETALWFGKSTSAETTEVRT